MMEAEKKEVVKQETARTGKPLTSMTATRGTSRQQALAAKKSKAQEKRDGKQVATVEGEVVGGRKSAPPKRSKEPKDKGISLPQVEDSEDITKEDQTPLRKPRCLRAKRFADIKIMEELEIDKDIKSMLEHMNMQSFFSMTQPTYEEVSCQFLTSLEASFHTSKRVRQRWGKIKFKVHEKVHYMTFKEIGQALGLKDLEESSIPILYDAPKEESIAKLVWKVLAGKDRRPNRDKNASICHPSVHYLHRLIVHTIFPRKEPETVNDEELQLLHQTVQHYASPPQLPLVNTDFYKNFGMVEFFVKRLTHYKEWAWTTSDSEPHIGIGGLITPLLYASPKLEPNKLEAARSFSFDIGEEHFLAPHGSLDPMSSPKKKKTADKCGMYQEDTFGLNSELLCGPPRYHFEQRSGALASGPLRQAHEHIGNLQRWNKAQDITIFKLKNKCKELSKTVKRQVEASAQFMKKVADILTRGAVAGCSTADFDFLTPQP
ncbi:hypothetical protein F2Q70_00008423 [Brassica cretica]|uniref:Arabidopsis retrotransposon Orf1 C-terminal domain-containing protein n=1 Tax=Brassica cretica TaxID=69181 RepID=A0A8S9M260_BRACR|nr:hypothetical protein F2Q70_00008423 [Brassica cretica]